MPKKKFFKKNDEVFFHYDDEPYSGIISAVTYPPVWQVQKKNPKPTGYRIVCDQKKEEVLDVDLNAVSKSKEEAVNMIRLSLEERRLILMKKVSDIDHKLEVIALKYEEKNDDGDEND